MVLVCLLSGVRPVPVDRVLDRPLLLLPRDAAEPDAAAHLLHHAAGSRRHHGRRAFI